MTTNFSKAAVSAAGHTSGGHTSGGHTSGAHKSPLSSKEEAWRQTLAISLLNHPTLIEANAESIVTKLDDGGFESDLLHGICASPPEVRTAPEKLRNYLVAKGFDLAKLEKNHMSIPRSL